MKFPVRFRNILYYITIIAQLNGLIVSGTLNSIISPSGIFFFFNSSNSIFS